jgi:AcrR family transcriptional regulator
MTPNSLAESHKNSTRARIRAATLSLAETRGIDRTRMEEIAVAAGVGRATVYFHYANKGAILLDIFREQLDRQLKMHERLIGEGPLTRERISGWLGGFIAVLKEHRPELSLFKVASSQDPELHGLVVAHREKLLDLLLDRSEGLARAFRTAGEAGERRLRTEALLLLLEFDGFATNVAADYPGLDQAIGAEIVTDHLWRFIESAGQQ